jgi:hypothetical protein
MHLYSRVVLFAWFMHPSSGFGQNLHDGLCGLVVGGIDQRCRNHSARCGADISTHRGLFFHKNLESV